ncbi:class I SAM-dependent methyltransferase [Candidatus Margulisiibacteriota bacterium]
MWRKIVNSLIILFNKACFNPGYLSFSRRGFWNIDEYKQFLSNNIKFSEKMKILDVGCGIGFLTSLLHDIAPPGTSITGIDISKNNIEYAKKNNKDKNIQFIESDAYNTDFPNKTFDLIICQSLFINIAFPGKLLNEMIRVSKNRGIIIGLEPLVTDLYYFPQFKYINFIFKLHTWFIRLFSSLFKVDRNVTLKLPQLFMDANLEDVQVAIYVQLDFLPQHKKIDAVVGEAASNIKRIKAFKNAGTRSIFRRILRKSIEEKMGWYQKVIKNPAIIKKTGEIKVNPMLLVKGGKSF